MDKTIDESFLLAAHCRDNALKYWDVEPCVSKKTACRHSLIITPHSAVNMLPVVELGVNHVDP